MGNGKAVRIAVVILLALVPAGQAFQAGYRIGKMDILRIEVPGEPEFSRESATVSEKGTISYGVVGELEVDGLSVSELSDLIRKALVEKKILTNPSVGVSVKEYRSQSVTILGEVKATGKYYLRGPEKLVDKLAEAGGITPVAGEITISRATPEGNRMLAVKSADLLSDTTLLAAGDVIFVKPRELQQVFVTGEVVAAKPLTYTDGLTVTQAVLMAGGLSRFGNKSKVTVKRTAAAREEIFKLNLSDIEKGKAKDFALLPNDLVVVGRRIF